MSPGPARMPLTPRQAQVLAAAADGAPLRTVAERTGSTREQAASLLSRAYERLGVADTPRAQRRAEAVRTAVQRGLLPDPEQPTTEA